MPGNAGAAFGIQWVEQKMPPKPAAEPPESDSALVQSIAANDHAAFEPLMRRHNGRLFRVARAILRDDSEAEDALQDAYLDAYRHIGDFRGDAQVGTWLTRIVINQALMRLRRQKRDRVVVPFGDGHGAGRRAISGGRRGRRQSRVAAGGDAARRDPAHPRAPDRRAAGRVSHGVRHARGRGDDRRRKPPSACRSPPRPSARGCSARGRCCARRWRATSTAPRSRSSASPASAAIASSPRVLAGASAPRSTDRRRTSAGPTSHRIRNPTTCAPA